VANVHKISSTVEFWWLEVEGTVKIIFSYQKFEPSKFRAKCYPVSLCYDKLTPMTGVP